MLESISKYFKIGLMTAIISVTASSLEQSLADSLIDKSFYTSIASKHEPLATQGANKSIEDLKELKKLPSDEMMVYTKKKYFPPHYISNYNYPSLNLGSRTHQLFLGSINDNKFEISIRDKSRNASWSPDGKYIVFQSPTTNSVNPNDSGTHIFIYDLNTNKLNQITDYSYPWESKSLPIWSPKGDKIAYVMNKNSIHIINPNGSNDRQLTPFLKDSENYSTLVQDIEWSPNGEIIFFTVNSQKYISLSKLYSIHTDGTDFKKLRKRVGNKFSVSNNGLIVYVNLGQENSNYNEIHLMNLDGSEDTQITNMPNIIKFNPLYSPDGSMIAFETSKDNNRGLYIIKNNGSGITQVLSQDFYLNRISWTADNKNLILGLEDRYDPHIFQYNIQSKSLEHIVSDGFYPVCGP